MQSAINVLIETIERVRMSQSSRSMLKELQGDLRAIAGLLTQVPPFFPQLRESSTQTQEVYVTDGVYSDFTATYVSSLAKYAN